MRFCVFVFCSRALKNYIISSEFIMSVHGDNKCYHKDKLRQFFIKKPQGFKMSKSIIEEQVRKFLSSPTPEVMAIKGPWGVGKTYSWNYFLEKAKRDKIIKFQNYSYVSLFGVNTLEALKYSIFENSIPTKNIGIEPSIDTFKENATGILTQYGKKAGGLFKNIPLTKNLTPVLESLAFMSLKYTIICIDDLERKGSALSLKDVLGLVSLLKEHKNCKVILLLNDGTKETVEFSTYKEKVLDIELTFEPTPEESASIAFDGSKPFHAKISEFTAKLKIINIRILKKIERSIDVIESHFKKTESTVFNDAISSVVLFSWCFYGFNNDEKIPNLDFISSNEFFMYGVLRKEEVKDPKKIAWKKVISDYGYKNNDDVDSELINLVVNGYVKDSLFTKIVNEKNELVAKGISREAFYDAWKGYHDSFDNDEDEVLENLILSFRENYKSIPPSSLDEFVEFLRRFDLNDEAERIVDFYIDGRKDEVGIFNVKSHDTFRSLRDGYLIDAFNLAYGDFGREKSTSLLEVLKRVHEGKGSESKDFDIMLNSSIEDYYNAFKSAKGNGVYDIVEAALQYRNYGGNNEGYKIIVNKAKWALTMISYESRINKMRVERFDVNLEG